MKKCWIILLLAALLLTGCGQAADKHPDWDASWVRVGDFLAVEPAAGFDLNESNDTLSLSGIWYFTWSSGDGREITNASGEDATAYDAQIYLLLTECGSREEAESSITDWMAREAQTYDTGERVEHTISGQSFQILPMTTTGESNPYSCGAAAFAVRDKLAISVELLCSDGFAGDSQALLEQFLSGLHYGD